LSVPVQGAGKHTAPRPAGPAGPALRKAAAPEQAAAPNAPGAAAVGPKKPMSWASITAKPAPANSGPAARAPPGAAGDAPTPAQALARQGAVAPSAPEALVCSACGEHGHLIGYVKCAMTEAWCVGGR